MGTNTLKARENELRVLQAIGLIGWLSTTQVAKWVWGTNNARSARVSADKVLKRLQDEKLVKRRESALGVYVYVLTNTGAIRANEGVKIPIFRDGYDLSQLDVGRQAPAVEYLTVQQWAGKTVLGAATVRKAISDGLLNGKAFKGVDGLVLDNETGEKRAVLVVRNTHPELIRKAKRIKKAAGDLELLGSVGLLKAFRREMLRP